MGYTEKPWFPVIIGGLLTTAATLAVVHFLSLYADFNVMGLYVQYILPVGAFLVGAGAVSGYFLASRQFEIKVTNPLVAAIMALQLFAYGGGALCRISGCEAGIRRCPNEAGRIGRFRFPVLLPAILRLFDAHDGVEGQ